MLDTMLTTVLPYAAMIGIVVSAVTSINLVVRTFLKSQNPNPDVIPRLVEINSALNRNAAQIEAHMLSFSVMTVPSQAQATIVSLHDLAADLQSRAGEVRGLLDQIGSEGRNNDDLEERERVKGLKASLSQTESHIADVARKIDLKTSELAAVQSANNIYGG